MDIERQLSLMDDIFDHKSKKELNDILDAVLSKHRQDISVDDYLDSMQGSSPLNALALNTDNSKSQGTRIIRKSTRRNTSLVAN